MATGGSTEHTSTTSFQLTESPNLLFSFGFELTGFPFRLLVSYPENVVIVNVQLTSNRKPAVWIRRVWSLLECGRLMWRGQLCHKCHRMRLSLCGWKRHLYVLIFHSGLFIWFFKFIAVLFFLNFHLFSTLTFQTERGRKKNDTSLFRILLLLRASSHFHPFPPSPTPDSSLYRCSHKSHNAPVIITPTPVYLQPVAWRGASLSLSLCLPLSLTLHPLFFSVFPPSSYFILSLVISFLLLVLFLS